MLLGGIDEAGRGPVLGPLVIAGVVIEEKDLGELKKLGVKDSKLIAPDKREKLFTKILTLVKNHSVLIIEPSEIDEALFSETMNLNWLEAKKSILIINELKPEKVIVDCPSPNLVAYKNYLSKDIDGIEIIVEHKADVNHLVVGAASIIAKVTRDREIKKLQEGIGENFGSGYCVDPLTKEFLKKNWKTKPELFRKTWSSYREMVGKAEQTTLFSNF